SGVPYSVVLQAGETYQFRDTQNTPHDVTGTLIIADKPVAVFGSHQCANVATKDVFFCDYLVEQLLPSQHGGTNFVVMPLKTRNGDTFRFLALEDKTDVFVNGVVVAPNLDRGRFRETLRTGPSHIRSTRPIMVAQYANSANYDNVVISDPFMTIIPPTRLFLSSYMICVPSADFPSNHVNIVIPSAAAGTVLIDGVAVPAAAYSVIPGSGYSGAQPNVATGPHLVQSLGGAAGPIPFGLIVYGFNEFDSYGYPGGFALGDTTPPNVMCQQSNITVVLGGSTVPSCFASVPDLRSQVTVTDNCQLPSGVQVQQIPAPQTPVGPGTHMIIVRAQDLAGNIGECQTTLTVVDPSPVLLTCPSNVLAFCTSSAGARVNYIGGNARSTCRTNIPVTCNPSAGSTFPPGTTTVVCSVTTVPGQTANCTFLVTVRCLTGTINRTGQEGTVTWIGGGVLEGAPTPTGRWTTVASESPHRFTIGAGSPTRFFRVRY
ncbi:MAG TPA: IgGFc-binding protein, partial [Verrucomicrobiae bacterium]|nr:IgGFc-binding protein [Verrucomicrobiae bacterium]